MLGHLSSEANKVLALANDAAAASTTRTSARNIFYWR